jgi:hypothetical protein
MKEDEFKCQTARAPESTGFEGFEGAFGSDFPDEFIPTTVTITSEPKPSLSSLSDSVASNGPGRAIGVENSGDIQNEIPLATGVSPALSYGLSVATSILPTLSLSWFAASADKPLDKDKKELNSAPEVAPAQENSLQDSKSTPLVSISFPPRRRFMIVLKAKAIHVHRLGSDATMLIH